MAIRSFNSLNDFLASNTLHVDNVLDDGWGSKFPLKGREIDGTVLFADIEAFSARTAQMSPVQTLAFAQNFFAWISAEALHGRPGIVDKYIGDEMMVVFSKEFGSEDPLLDALKAAAQMCRNDVHAYHPRIGIASGRMIVGYAGTPLRYSVSVFGAPVSLAARCAGVRATGADVVVSSTITLPASEWAGRAISDILINPAEADAFALQEERSVDLRNLGSVNVRQVWSTGVWIPTQTAEDRARESVSATLRAGRYWPTTG